ncbi:MAG: fimbria/pilus periplasmic chaperone [bacterium]|nr:molecular chaperone [Spirochaetales bacterium]MDT3389882.1 fimbria/pilus periplasmic chaperone [bacterium]
MLRKNILIVVFLVLVVCAASAFQFSPLEQTFKPTGEESQKTYTIVNDSDDAIAISLSVVVRDQDAQGNEVRQDASAQFQIMPAKVIVNPQSTYVVRVKYMGPSTVTVEKAYRLIAEQVPYSQGKSQTSQSMFNFLYVYATSLYVVPSDEVKRVEISAVKARIDEEGNKVMDVTIRNRGNVHQILTDAVLTVKGPKGDTVTLSGNEQISGIDSTNILARKEVTKTIAWPDGLEFVEGGKYTGSLEYSET